MDRDEVMHLYVVTFAVTGYLSPSEKSRDCFINT